MHPGKNINIEDFNYDFPADRIAQFPLQERDHSRLLIYKDKHIEQDFFYNIKHHLPNDSLLILNDTKVIHARLLFPKETGSVIEIFCLSPDDRDLNNTFSRTSHCIWKCLVGNSKRWKSGTLKIEHNNTILFAKKISKKGEESIIHFLWEPENLSFGEILEIFGKVPLPPYINRNTVENDDITYQTIFANKKGSVAAPTAGLHFTEQTLKELKDSGIKTMNLTLHVGAGTFKPVTSKTIDEHVMHDEHVSVSKQIDWSYYQAGST